MSITMEAPQAPIQHEDTEHMLAEHAIAEAEKHKDFLENPSIGDQAAFDTSSKRGDTPAYPEFSMTRESLSEAQGEHYAKAQAAVEAAVPKPEVTIAAKTAGEIVAQQTIEQ